MKELRLGYDFAVAIQDFGLQLGLLDNVAKIHSILPSGISNSGKRPSYSVIDKSSAVKASGKVPQHWRHQLLKMMSTLFPVNYWVADQ